MYEVQNSTTMDLVINFTFCIISHEYSHLFQFCFRLSCSSRNKSTWADSWCVLSDKLSSACLFASLPQGGVVTVCSIPTPPGCYTSGLLKRRLRKADMRIGICSVISFTLQPKTPASVEFLHFQPCYCCLPHFSSWCPLSFPIYISLTKSY